MNQGGQNDPKMPPGGAKELLKSGDGRKYLAKIQERYTDDILQPNNPRFKRVWGAKLERNHSIRVKQEDEAKSLWQENKERREFEQRKKTSPGAFRKFI